MQAWVVVDGHHLEKEYILKNFAEALSLANRMGQIAEEQDHHPELTVAWGRLIVRIWTHDAHGITSKDHRLADLYDELWMQWNKSKSP